MQKLRKMKKLLIKIAVVVSTILFGFAMCVTVITSQNKTAINNFMKAKTYEIIEPESAKDIDKEYYKSRYKNLKELIAAGREAAETVEAEGAVLLMNKNDALPLDTATEKKISLVGISSVDPAYGGKGSAQTRSPQKAVTPEEGFKQAGFEVNPALLSFYSASSSNQYKRSGRGENAKIKDAPWGVIDDKINDGAYGDAAIYIITRIGGEASDMALTGTDGEGGNYLKLSEIEKGVLSGLNTLKKQGKVKKIIVILNTTNQIETAFLNNAEYGIDAALWIGSTGVTGFNAVGDIIAGKVNPSGHLSDTYWYDHSANPTTVNFGDFAYTNSSSFNLPKTGSEIDSSYNRYVVYQEGIYVGYRYAETRYFDKVMGTNDKVGDFDYSSVISHPFGYGGSYTSFEFSDFTVTENSESNFDISVKVTNTGTVRSGKEVVQIYVQKPFVENGANTIETSAIDLVGYAKTKELAPAPTAPSGAETADNSQTVTLTVDRRDLAVYDDKVENTYILQSGDYIFTAATDAHDAVNNILAKNGKTTADGMTENGNTDLTQTVSLTLDTDSYTTTASFDFADVNKYFTSSENSVKYVTRTDWAGSLPTEGVSLKMTDKLYNDIMAQDNPANIATDSTKYPTYGKKTDLKLIHLRVDENGNKIPYDDPKWDELLDSMTWDDTLELLNTGLQSTKEVATVIKPGTVEHNGPTGLTETYGKNARGLAARTDDPDKDKTAPYYPCIGILASSFNKETAALFGDMMGEDAIWAGYAGLYGIGLNTHRSPYGGRLYEYFGEDPLLSGTMAAAEVTALQAHGCNAYIKHFALNDQETNRAGVGIWLNEQALREIYLRPFEIAVKEGGAMNAMAAFNRMGVIHCPGNKALLTDYLRGELGMRGLVVTDMFGIGYKESNMPAFMMAGCDIPDGEVIKTNPYNRFRKNHGDMAWQMREAAHRILYATVHSTAMNGISTESQLIIIVPGWQIAVIVLDCLFGAMLAASIAGAVIIIVKERKKPSDEKLKENN